MAIVTPKEIETWTLRHTAHVDGPRGRDGWFGDMHECVENPRLQRRTRYFRATRKHDLTWYVDGAEIKADGIEDALRQAADLLSWPPVLTDEERAVFERVTGDWQDLRFKNITSVLLMLRAKGLIEFADGKCRRRAAR